MTKRSIPGGVKDPNGIYTPTPVLPPPPESGVSEPFVEPESVALDDIQRKQLRIIYRQTRYFLAEAKLGPLSKDHEMAFDRLVRLTRELKKDELAALGKMGDKELEDAANGAPRDDD